ncbi:MAG: sterol desaturase family protein [Myxococcales bacterium]|nr:sterol desaturase family protein [Myxococcales bacterium]
MMVMLLLPFAAFWISFALVWMRPSGRAALRARTAQDWVLDGVNLGVQGWLVPLAAGWAGRVLLGPIVPAGSLHGGLLGGFLLAFVGVDALYYLNHRLLHRWWFVHRVHHGAPAMDVWVTSRNTVWATAFVVYPWAHGVFQHVLDAPQGYLFGASLTAALDLWRHCGADVHIPWLVTPRHHAWHHSRGRADVNFGANWILWDRLFGTEWDPGHLPDAVGIPTGLPLGRALLWPSGGAT